MKIMKIKIQDRETMNKELKSLAKSIDKKKHKTSFEKNDIFFESLAAVRKILTDKRLEVWRTIRDRKPESITQLAEMLDRGFRSVHRDVVLLKELGLIQLTEGPGKRGNVQQLISLYDELILAVA
jgi:predicted transcriptional regulator